MRGHNRVLAVLVMAAVAAVGGVCGLLLAGGVPDWASRAFTSALGLKCGIIILAGAAGIGVITLLLRNLEPRGKATRVHDLPGDEGGTAAVETTLLFPFALMIFLMIIQAALLFNANMVVHYAAFSAARVAITTIPLEIGAERPNLVYNPDYPPNPASTKFELIRRAAALALVPISSYDDISGVGGGTGTTSAVEAATKRAFGALGAEDAIWFWRITKQARYADRFTDTYVPPPAHWKNDGNPHNDCPYRAYKRGEWTQWGWEHVPFCPFHEARWDYWYYEEIGVIVDYAYHLRVPYARALMRDSAGDIASRLKTDLQVPTGSADFALIQALGVLSNEGHPELDPEDEDDADEDGDDDDDDTWQDEIFVP